MLRAQQAAEEAARLRQQTKEQRRQAEQQQAQLRKQLQEQLNAITQTRETARGLIMSIPDVLFDTAKYTLRSTARERLEHFPQ
ncbi:MAG: hypothetical protein HYX72_04735 [Acidobacteria bacterium]|nr:hypothetical protein [Acidobacteriota bacterium]